MAGELIMNVPGPYELLVYVEIIVLWRLLFGKYFSLVMYDIFSLATSPVLFARNWQK